ncbi:MAG: F-box protein, partial [Parachlamydiales bacterium]|nr:F-box protein [Parachlamydiales bacterium]
MLRIENTISLLNLPKDTIHQIASYLEPKYLINFQLSCKGISRYLAGEDFWKIYYPNRQLSIYSHLLKSKKICTNTEIAEKWQGMLFVMGQLVKRFRFDTKGVQSDVFEILKIRAPRLEELDFNDWVFQEERIRIISECFTSLQILVITNSTIPHRSALSFKLLTSLTSLNLDNSK